MIEALVAFVLAVLFVFVFQGPAFILRLGVVGGVGFVCWVLILVIEWLLGKLKS